MGYYFNRFFCIQKLYHYTLSGVLWFLQVFLSNYKMHKGSLACVKATACLSMILILKLETPAWAFPKREI